MKLDAGGTPYGLAALRDICSEVAATPPGSRNDLLNRKAVRIGNLVGGGQLDESALDALRNAGRNAGLDEQELDKVLRLDDTGGYAFGLTQPAVPEPLEKAASAARTWKPPTTTGDASTEVQERHTPSWAPLNLRPFLDGEREVEQPELMRRTDGVLLLYRGRVHSVYGESESGKSMLMHAVAAEVILGGGRVLVIDYENDERTITDRLLKLGLTPAHIAEHLDYRRPESDPGTAFEAPEFASLLEQQFTLVVLDGVTEALVQANVASKDNDETTAWVRRVPRTIARRTGAAVVTVDHVVKDGDSRGRYAIGAQAKLASLDGAAYVVDVVHPLGRGLRGVLSLRIAKDRPGAVRPHGVGWRKGDRTAEVAHVVVDSTEPERIAVTLEPPADHERGEGQPAGFRPTHLMQRLSHELEAAAEPLSGRQLRDLVNGNASAKLTALELLVAEGFVSRVSGPRNAQRHRSLKPYRQGLDPLSDRYSGPEPLNLIGGSS